MINTGITAIVSPNGKRIKQAAQFKKIVLKGEIYPMGGLTPYARLGDHIFIAALVLGLFILLIKSYLMPCRAK